VTLLVALLSFLAGAAVAGGLAWWALRRGLDAHTSAEAGRSRGLAEEVVARERELDHLRASLEALPLGVVAVDADGTVLLRNHQAERVLGVHHLDALVSEAIEQHLESALDGQSRSSSLDVFGPPRRTLRVAATPVPLAGDEAAALVTIEDVTERVRLDTARTDMVANLTHELKTPVGGIALLAETLADEDEPEVVARLAPKLVNEAHRLARIIDELLELSRVELGGLAATETVGVRDVVREAIDRTRPLAADRNIDLRVLLEDSAAELVGNRRQMVSALGNLVENAVKYSDDGSAVVVRSQQDGPWLELVVEDRGIGIPARDLERVFERFFRVDKARSRETGGTGLGLSIVRHVAQNHGGTVTVVSHEGEGSTFTLRLPRAGAGLTQLAEAG
jgi:two-component system sensor histidine kinase SenX3